MTTVSRKLRSIRDAETSSPPPGHFARLLIEPDLDSLTIFDCAQVYRSLLT
jgi:hypothetical protein